MAGAIIPFQPFDLRKFKNFHSLRPPRRDLSEANRLVRTLDRNLRAMADPERYGRVVA